MIVGERGGGWGGGGRDRRGGKGSADNKFTRVSVVSTTDQ